MFDGSSKSIDFLPLGNNVGNIENGKLFPISLARKQTDEEKRIETLKYKQLAIIQAKVSEAEYADNLLSNLNIHAAVTYDFAGRIIMAMKQSERDSEHQPYMDEFCSRIMQMMGRQILGISEITAANIGEQLMKSLDIPPEKVGLFQRLLG